MSSEFDLINGRIIARASDNRAFLMAEKPSKLEQGVETDTPTLDYACAIRSIDPICLPN
jgi:hypothetical protein